MKRISLVVALVVMLTSGMSVATYAAVDMGGKATAAEALSDAQIDQLMSVSLLENSINSVPSLINSSITRAKPKLSDEQKLQLSQDLNDGKVTTLLLDGVRTDIRAKLDMASYKEVMAWFATETGKRMVAAEKAVSQPSQQDKMQKYVSQGAGNAIEFDRMQILTDLDNVTRASLTQKLVMDDLVLILRDLTGSKIAAAQAQKNTAIAKRDVSDQIIYAMSFAYTGLPNSDLQAYAAFYRTPTGQKWVDVLRGLTRTMWYSINQSAMGHLMRLEKK
jgi:hypothetical protein